MSDATEIRWPEHYHPRNTAVHVRNEIDIAAAPEIVWAWLIRAERWPSWYINSANVRFINAATPDLALGTRFNGRRSASALIPPYKNSCRMNVSPGTANRSA